MNQAGSPGAHPIKTPGCLRRASHGKLPGLRQWSSTDLSTLGVHQKDQPSPSWHLHGRCCVPLSLRALAIWSMWGAVEPWFRLRDHRHIPGPVSAPSWELPGVDTHAPSSPLLWSLSSSHIPSWSWHALCLDNSPTVCLNLPQHNRELRPWKEGQTLPTHPFPPPLSLLSTLFSP